MPDMSRLGFLFLSLLMAFSVPAMAAELGPCTLQSKVGKGFFYLNNQILGDEDLRQAVACAINRGGDEAAGFSSFRTVYNILIEPSDISRIRVQRAYELESFWGQSNRYLINFTGVYDGRVEMPVYCEVLVEKRPSSESSGIFVMLDLTYCMAQTEAFLIMPHLPLRASVVYTPVK